MSEQFTELYEFELEGEETLDDRPVYLIDAVAREGEEVAYYKRKFWVDAERFVILKEEMYARGGRVLKEMVTTEVEKIEEGRWFPVEMVMEDLLREDTETIYRVNEIELDYDIPENMLSVEALE